MSKNDFLYEFAPDGRTVDRHSDEYSLENLKVTAEDLTIAFLIETEVTRTVYEYDGAYYAEGRDSGYSFIGPPASGAHAFARQPLPTGKIGILLGDTWLLRVTEPYWRVIAGTNRGGRPPVSIEPRFSLVSAPIGADCYHLNQWDAAVADATKQAERLKVDLPVFGYEQSVTVGINDYPNHPTLGRLWERCPQHLKDHPIKRTQAAGQPVTDRDIRELAAAGDDELLAAADEQWGVRPGGELTWLNRLKTFSCRRNRSVLIEADGQHLLTAQDRVGTIRGAGGDWTGTPREDLQVGSPLVLTEGNTSYSGGIITKMTEVGHPECHHPVSDLLPQCCTATAGR